MHALPLASRGCASLRSASHGDRHCPPSTGASGVGGTKDASHRGSVRGSSGGGLPRAATYGSPDPWQAMSERCRRQPWNSPGRSAAGPGCTSANCGHVHGVEQARRACLTHTRPGSAKKSDWRAGFSPVRCCRTSHLGLGRIPLLRVRRVPQISDHRHRSKQAVLTPIEGGVCCCISAGRAHGEDRGGAHWPEVAPPSAAAGDGSEGAGRCPTVRRLRRSAGRSTAMHEVSANPRVMPTVKSVNGR